MPVRRNLPADSGKIGDYEFVRALAQEMTKIFLPKHEGIRPDRDAIRWHRQHVFDRQVATYRHGL